jgi:hypothetical protein
MRHAVFAICLKMELIKGIAPVSKHASSFLSHVFDKKYMAKPLPSTRKKH